MSKTNEELIMARVDLAAAPPCWTWTGHLSRGYGRIKLPGHRRLGAHQASYMVFRGPVPAGLHLDHLCRNPACVNPDHLEPVTQRENVLRGVSPMAGNARKTHCSRGHEFTAENTDRRGNGRRCRQCNREYFSMSKAHEKALRMNARYDHWSEIRRALWES